MGGSKCCICDNHVGLLPLTHTDCRNISFKTKLTAVVPEVVWRDQDSICYGCIDRLILATCFREDCLTVYKRRDPDAPVKPFKICPAACQESQECTEGPGPSEKHVEWIPIQDRIHLVRLTDEIQKPSCRPYDKISDNLSKEGKKDALDSRTSNEIEDSNHENDGKMLESFICFHCDESFDNKSILANHIKITHVTKVLCPDCGLEFKNETLLKNHFKQTHSNNKSYKCSTCEKSYKVEKVMKTHYETCEGVKKHPKLNFSQDSTENKCEKCGRFYTTDKILKAHMKNCKGFEAANCYICNIPLSCDKHKSEHVLQEHGINLDIESTCPHCYKECVTLQELKVHLVENHNDIIKSDKRKNYANRSYSCEFCPKIFGFVKEVIEHCIKEHEIDSKLVKPFLCDKCDNRFSSSANLIQHKQYHEGIRSHICSFCGKSYITKSDLTVHEYTHLNKRNYKCEFCDRAFNTNKNLRSHNLVVHTDASLWKFHCEKCDKRFPLKSGYDQHNRRHAGDKRFQCLICTKSFVSSSELRKHLTFHSNVRAFKCAHCDKEYRDRRFYEIHLTKVHGMGNAKIPVRVKRHSCHICPSKFFDKQKLERHICTHTGIKPFPCTMCDKKFTAKSYLKNHMKVAHNVNMDEMNDSKV